MSTKYEIIKQEFSVDVVRKSDGHACGFMAKRVWQDLGSTYQSDDNEVKAGTKNEGDVRVAAKGWQEEDYDWDVELTRVFGEVDADLKTALTSHFTDDLKAKYVTAEKAK
tara:strand:- start:99 stop:428 length:330 start_codon:yes stop_codon:yes gene_type:complete